MDAEGKRRKPRVSRLPKPLIEVMAEADIGDAIKEAASARASAIPLSNSITTTGNLGASWGTSSGNGGAGGVIGQSTVTTTYGAGSISARKARSQPCDERNTLVGGMQVVTHRKDDCWGYWCPVHNQSPHHMRGWRQVYDRDDIPTMQRECPCGSLHPDPDAQDSDHGWHMRSGCCGCCNPRRYVTRRAV